MPKKTAMPENVTPEIEETPAPRGQGASRVYESLKTDILSMVLPPGEPLDETSLSARFSLSRTPIREALQKLVADGLAATLPNRTTIVSMIDIAGLPDHLDALCLMHRITARLAAERATRPQIQGLLDHQNSFVEAVRSDDIPGMIAINHDFHLAIADIAGNRYYRDLMARLLNDGIRLQRLYYRALGDRLPQEYVDEHDQLIDALNARDADKADRIARQHAQQVADQIRRFVAIAEADQIILG
ncbi:GntR family transcriptional regulator [Lacibacterium aquatile]|uniref:GntR family transcriptional regulator n=1 Tax=Lacibacterium aquatile TaxID=1168082 RepID=A0ABW5DRT1_9PROT